MPKIIKSTAVRTTKTVSDATKTIRHNQVNYITDSKQSSNTTTGMAAKSKHQIASGKSQKGSPKNSTQTINKLKVTSAQTTSTLQAKHSNNRHLSSAIQPSISPLSKNSRSAFNAANAPKATRTRQSQRQAKQQSAASTTARLSSRSPAKQVSKQSSPATIKHIFETLQHLNPEPDTELHYANDFTLLVSIILSAQSTDQQVNKVTAVLFQTVQTPEDILQLGLESLKQAINSLGLYNAKAKNILQLSKILIEQYHSTVPTEREILKTLPGVGQKTANVFLNVAYHQPFIGVDTHVVRLSYRLGLIDQPLSNPAQIEEAITQTIPPQYHAFVNHWLVLHGRYICKAKQPQCEHCPLAQYCPRNGLEPK